MKKKKLEKQALTKRKDIGHDGINGHYHVHTEHRRRSVHQITWRWKDSGLNAQEGVCLCVNREETD